MSDYPFDLTTGTTPNPWGGNYGGTLPPTSSSATDRQNGSSGALTPASTANATTQSQQGKSSGNVFTDVLNHVASFNAALGAPTAQSIPSDGPIYRNPDPTQPPPTGAPPVSTQPSPTTQQPSSRGGGLQIGAPYGSDPASVVTPGNISTGTDTFDANGIPYSAKNPPPKPPNTEDANVAAAWYRKYQYLNPAFANITTDDVNNYRISGFQGDFATWYTSGKPSPAQQPPPGTTPDQPQGGGGYQSPQAPAYSLDAAHKLYDSIGGQKPSFEQWHQAYYGFAPNDTGAAGPPDRTAPPQATPPPAQGAPPAGAPPTTPVAPPQAPTPDGAGTPPPTTPSTPGDEIQRLIDLFNSGKGPQQPPIEDMLNPMFARQRQLVADQMRAGYAAQGIHSGGADYNVNQAESNLAGQQSAALASQMGQDYLAKLNQNTQLTQLATQAGMQKYLSDINTDLEKYKVNTNSDLQKWLTDQNNVLARYGIDTNDVLQRYLAKVGIDKANIDANATIQAAALHAAAAEAGAAASSAAAQYSANVQLQLGTGNLQVTREHNMADFILGLMGLGQGDLSMLGNVFNNFPTGAVVVKP